MVVKKAGKSGNVISIERITQAIPLCRRYEGAPFAAVAITIPQATLIQELCCLTYHVSRNSLVRSVQR
jgi:hypothetical protein